MVHKTIQQARANLEASTTLIPDRYKVGVEGADWAGPAGSDQAEQNYMTGTQKAASNKTRQKMIKKISNQDWQSKSIQVGANRIVSGIKANLDKYDQNFGPILDKVVAAAKTLPPRTNDWNSNIDNRLKKIVKTAVEASPKNK